MKTIFSILLAAVAYITNAQSTTLLKDAEDWCDGSIMTSQGTELKGLVKYNDKTGILSYHDGENSRAFSPRTAAGFEFYDRSLEKQRVFYTLEYAEEQEGSNKQFFFELIRDYKTFAVLSKVDRIEIEQKTGMANPVHTSTGVAGPTTWVEVSQKETIFIMSVDGSIEPYLQFVDMHDNRANVLLQEKDPKKRGKVLDEDVLAKYIGEPHFKQLQHFARENNLKFRKKEDFLRILTYYDAIKGN